MRIVPAGILTAAIILTTAACSSAGSSRSVDSRPSGESRTSAAPAPLAGLTADQIVQKALKDLAAASSVRITGQLPINQQGNVAIDLTDVAPASCQGTIALASAGASGPPTAAITKVDGTAYVKLNQSYLKNLHVPAGESAELNGKYIKSSSSSTIADLSHLCVLSTLVNAFTQGDTGFAKAGTVTVEGQPALALTQPNATDGGTVYVSDGATPVILSLQETGGPLAFLDFTDFNAPVTITAPPAADIFYGAPSLD